MKNNEEELIQKAVVQHLRLLGVDGLVWYHCPNGEHRSKRTGARLKAMGVIPGVPDICGILPDSTPFFLEIKASKGRTSKPQIEFLERAERSGAIIHVANSIDGCLHFLSGIGAIKK